MDAMELTLEDVLESLTDTKADRLNEIEHLNGVISNNKPATLSEDIVLGEMQMKRNKLCTSLSNQLRREEPKDYPLPKTTDLYIEILDKLDEETLKSQELLRKMNVHLSNIKENIARLEQKKAALENMEQAYLGMNKMVANTSYDREIVLSKRIFHKAKKDLITVVDILFPDNVNIKQLLHELTAAYIKGGDDTYIDVLPEYFDYVNFLIEGDIVVYHRNDKNKIKLANM